MSQSGTCVALGPCGALQGSASTQTGFTELLPQAGRAATLWGACKMYPRLRGASWVVVVVYFIIEKIKQLQKDREWYKDVQTT